ncbi:hypothetical protein PRIPAC_85836, partial [Pristionchus pacificus]|uniref:Uncharacterized protein n=1 Tax=Pristionchus pacificus TaxID=54126 RepID=A0A2A6BUD9_PRIPA
MMTSLIVLRNAARQCIRHALISRSNFQPTKLGMWVYPITPSIDATTSGRNRSINFFEKGMPNILQKEFWFYLNRLRNYEFSSLQHMPAPGAPHFAIRPMTSSFLPYEYGGRNRKSWMNVRRKAKKQIFLRSALLNRT